MCGTWCNMYYKLLTSYLSFTWLLTAVCHWIAFESHNGVIPQCTHVCSRLELHCSCNLLKGMCLICAATFLAACSAAGVFCGALMIAQCIQALKPALMAALICAEQLRSKQQSSKILVAPTPSQLSKLIFTLEVHELEIMKHIAVCKS